MGKRLQRNAVITDPTSGQRRVLKAGSLVDDDLVALVDPKAFGEVPRGPEPIPAQAPADFQGVPLEALVAYAEGRGVDVSGLSDGVDVLGALIDADEALAEQMAVATSDHDGDGDEQARIANVLAGTLDDVNAHLDEHPEDIPAVLAAEAAAEKPRKGITEGPHATPAAEPPSTQQA